MKNQMRRMLYGVMISVFLTSCAMMSNKPEPAFSPVDLNSKVQSGEYQKKVDNFLIIFDDSSSMKIRHEGTQKQRLAKRVVTRLNQTLPALDIQSGLRVFGPSRQVKAGQLAYGMTAYSTTGLAEAIGNIPSAAGLTPLAKSIEVTGADLDKTSGTIAVIIISDAEEVGANAAHAATDLKNQYSDRLCIYTIHIGGDKQGKALMDKIANAGQCGFATDYASIESPEGMASFVERVFLEKATDSDGDGVYDHSDKCPNTPKGTAVDAVGCPIPAKMATELDSDSDGVVDSKDQCPGTPMGMKVDQHGCPLPITEPVTIELRVEFDFDKDVVRAQYNQELLNFANFLNSHPNLTVVLEGHTDNYGSEAYNQGLSLRRAESVKRFLTYQFRVNESAIKTKGYSFTRPEASNETREGRQKNRRVYATITAK